MTFLKFAGAAVALSLTAMPAAIAQGSANDIATCMVANTSASDEQALKDLMIKALSDAPAAELQSSTMAFGMSMIGLATGKCGVSMSELQGPAFGNAASIYGEMMGEKIMGEAMSKIGQ